MGPGAHTVWPKVFSAAYRLPRQPSGVGRVWDRHLCLHQGGRSIAPELCRCLWSLQQVAAASGCPTHDSAAMVHCMRQKSEKDLLETTMKMVGASTPEAPTLFPGPQACCLLAPIRSLSFSPLRSSVRLLIQSGSFVFPFLLSDASHVNQSKNHMMKSCITIPQLNQTLIFCHCCIQMSF